MLGNKALKAGLAGVAVVLGFFAEMPTAKADDTRWGAVAFSPSTGKWGYSRGWLSIDNARRNARENCKAADAAVIALGGNCYIALATGSDNAYGVGLHANPDRAIELALKYCREHASDAKLVLLYHSQLTYNVGNELR